MNQGEEGGRSIVVTRPVFSSIQAWFWLFLLSPPAVEVEVNRVRSRRSLTSFTATVDPIAVRLSTHSSSGIPYCRTGLS